MKIIRSVSLIILLILLNTVVKSQDLTIVKLKSELNNATSDTSRFVILDSLSIYYLFCSDKIDSSYFYANERIKQTFPLADKRELILSYARMGSYFYFTVKYGAALQILHKAIALSEQINFYDYSSFLYLTIAEIYSFLNQFNKAKTNLEKAEYYLRFNKDPFYNIRARTYVAYSINYLLWGKFDSASIYLHKVEESFNGHTDLVTEDLYLGWMAMLKLNLKEYEEAKEFSLKGIEAVKKNDDHQVSDFIYYQYAIILEKTNKPGEGITQAKLALDAAKAINDLYFMVPISKIISEYFDKLGKMDSTLYYLKLNADYYAQLDSARNISDVEAAAFSEQMHVQETQAQNILTEEKNKGRLRLYGFITGFGILLLVSLIMWRNSVQRKKAYALLQQQKLEIELQKSKAEFALKELKSTQAQLIQSEKMASLGELTAGIAHEIQNPLNFVNNFSEVNKELIEELEGERSKVKGERNEELENEILNDIKANEDKINHHGKRADAIVKGMLQHSRSSSGIKEPTDINALADEYLRLAYHGLRAKDNSFNATMKTDYDETIGNINTIPQDIGRVLLNLYNNAFYAVSERRASTGSAAGASTGSAANPYEPTVTVSTALIPPLGARGPQVQIKVADNGGGIPQKVLDKIFQPFFTTKPTGQGTGLGLSLSYDIVKTHGGELKVETKEARPDDPVGRGEGSEFIIQLPITA